MSSAILCKRTVKVQLLGISLKIRRFFKKKIIQKSKAAQVRAVFSGNKLKLYNYAFRVSPLPINLFSISKNICGKSPISTA